MLLPALEEMEIEGDPPGVTVKGKAEAFPPAVCVELLHPLAVPVTETATDFSQATELAGVVKVLAVAPETPEPLTLH